MVDDYSKNAYGFDPWGEIKNLGKEPTAFETILAIIVVSTIIIGGIFFNTIN